MAKNEFNPDYETVTYFIGKDSVDELSNTLHEISTIPSNIEDARKVNDLVLKCQNILCEWALSG